ncbi:hypothetical protein M0R45_012087 [Rubus argutus]|uniref:Uncharacterized protein n=1 Tax=Rubus argutus TaxID=59490 RepID=A0AAW1YBQ3_RUBAR
MEKAMSWVLVFFVIASCVPLFSRFPEAEAVKFCHKNADCKRGLCAGSLVWCVNGVCTCEVSRDESAAAPESEPNAPVLDKCSNVGDCKNMSCPPVIPIHRDCVNGECKCVR